MDTSPTLLDASPEDLFGRYRSRGDVKALGALFDRLSPELFRIALALTPDAASAEDALQETWLTALERAADFDPSRRVTPWLVGILRYKMHEVRRRVRKAPDPARLAPPAFEETVAESPEEAEKVQAEIAALPEPYRAVALMRWRYGLEPAEIAHIRNEAPGTTRSLLSRARQRLRKVLQAMPALFFGTRVPQGLDAVRDTVMTAAKGVAVATAASTAVVGGLIVKKLIAAGAVAAAVLLLAGTGWYVLGADLDRTPDDRSEHAGPETTDPRLQGRAQEVPTTDAPPRPTAAPDSALNAAVAGRVVDSRGQPLEDASVELLAGWFDDDPEVVARMETSADGAFVFEAAVEEGLYRLRAEAEEYTREECRAYGGGGPKSLTLWRAGRITGRVLDAHDGAPVPDARVYLRSWDHYWMHTGPRVTVETRTDGSGAYELTGVPEGRLQILVQPTVHASTSALVDLTAGDDIAHDIYVTHGTRVEGRVLLDGRPTAGIRVWVVERFGREYEDVSDEEGRYRLEGLVPTTWHLRAHDPAVGFGGERIDLPPGTHVVVRDVDLRPAVTIRGRVMLDGTPVAGARVATDPHEGDEPGVRTDAEGRYELLITGWGGLEEDIYAIHGDVAFGEIEVPLAEATTRAWDIPLTRYGHVSGRVLADDGSPLTGVHIEVQPPGAYWTVRTRVAADGRYVARAEPGEFILEAKANDRPYCPSVTVDVAAGETKTNVDLVLPTGVTLRGRVIDDAGNPIPRIYVTVSSGRHQSLQVLTDDEGRYEAHGLAGATVHASVSFPTRFAHVKPKSASAGSGDLDFVLPRLKNVIRGRVLGPDGGPCRSCEVIAAMVADRGGTPTAYVQPLETLPVSDAEGRFTIGPLPEHLNGQMRIHARTHEAVSQVVEGVVASETPESEVVLRLAPASWLRGVVRNKAGEPIPSLEFTHEGVTSYGTRLQVDGAGRLTAGPAPVGRHEVVFQPWGWVRHAFIHQAEAGRDVEVEVVLYVGGDVRLTVRDAAGQPVAGAKAEFLDAEGTVIPIDRRTNPNNREPHVPKEGQTTSDPEGLVHRQWLSPGPCQARVTLDGFRPAEVTVTVVDEDVVEAEIRLEALR